MSIFGFPRAVHEIVLHIHKKHPTNPIFLVGISAGTAICARYGGDIGYLCSNEAGLVRDKLYEQYGTGEKKQLNSFLITN